VDQILLGGNITALKGRREVVVVHINLIDAMVALAVPTFLVRLPL
jgi:hypothetical protein